MKKHRVGIDVRMWDHPGIGRYIRELTSELLPSAPDLDFVFYGYETSFKNSRPASLVEFVSVRSKIYSVSEQFEMPRASKDSDLLHVPHFNIPIFYNKKLVTTVHDLTYLHDPRAARSRFAGVYARCLLSVSAKKSGAILAVSEYTRNDLLNSFPGLSADKVFVTHESVSPFFKKINTPEFIQNEKIKFSAEKPFVLFVGSLKPHKNIPALIQAMAALKKEEKIPHELILVGRSDSQSREILRMIHEHSFVRYLGELGDEEVRFLYNRAEVFVLPSFREGFGLPLLEAMACGTPVISSDRTSLPEVVGTAGLTFDPHKVDALSGVLYNVLKNKDLRKKMSDLGLERVKQFSWKNTARKTLEVYRRVLK